MYLNLLSITKYLMPLDPVQEAITASFITIMDVLPIIVAVPIN